MQKQSIRLKETPIAPKEINCVQSNLSLFALKASLKISQSPLCRLLNFCTINNIDCSGKRNPWCLLEQKLEENSLPPFALEQLKRQKVIKLLLKINSKLLEKSKPTTFFEGKSFTCPFFRCDMEECDFIICPYHSPIVNNTNCILSVKKELTIEEIAIAKNISLSSMMKIIYELEEEKWELLEQYLKKGSTKISTCSKCGQFKNICYHDIQSCIKRQKYVDQIKNNAIVPNYFFNYPIILVLLAIKKVFGELGCNIYPAKIWKIYFNQLNFVI